MSVLTNAQVAALQRVLATCNQVLPRIEMLEALAAVNPDMRQRVAELRAQREYLVQLATTALEIDRQIVPTQSKAGLVAPQGTTWNEPSPRRTGPTEPGEDLRWRVTYGTVLRPGDEEAYSARGRPLIYDPMIRSYYYMGTQDEYQRSLGLSGP